MRQYDDMNLRLKSLNHKFQLQEEEQKEVLSTINQKMDITPPKKRVKIEWKYYLASLAAVLMIIIIAIPLLGNPDQELVQNGEVDPNPTKSPAASDTTEEEITIHIMNYTSYHLKNMQITISKEGEIKATQGGMYADGSLIEPGDTFEFQFYEEELGIGKVEIELDITDSVHSEEIEAVHTTPKMSLEIYGANEYHLKLYAESPTSYYIQADEDNFELEIYNEAVEMIREEVELGFTPEQIESLLGGDYREGISEDNKETWRYDIGAEEDYKSPDEIFEPVDLDKIKSGAVQAVVLFQWTDDMKLESYFGLYRDEVDGNVYAYHVFEDGREKVESIH